MCLPPNDFPDIHSGEYPEGFEIDTASLRRLIDKTLFSVSTEETRYYLNGIYLHSIKEKETEVLRARRYGWT